MVTRVSAQNGSKGLLDVYLASSVRFLSIKDQPPKTDENGPGVYCAICALVNL